MRPLGLVLSIVLVAACASTPTASGPSPSPSPVGIARFAVMVHRAGVGEAYIVQLVTPDGVRGASI